MFDSLSKIQIPPEVYAIGAVMYLMLYMHRQIKASDDLQQRWHRFLATMISKKMFAWGVVSIFFWYDHFVWAAFEFDVWAYLSYTAATFGLDIWQKHIGLEGKT